MVKFVPDRDIPDLSGKIILVTGGNNGLGFEMVKQLSKHSPAEIFVAARSRDKAEAAIGEIKELVPNAAKLTFLELDLGSLASVKRAADEFEAQSSRLHILVNNAGIMATPPGQTKEGYEIQFGTNHMGHALLTKLLLPTLEATAAAAASPGQQDVRIVTLASDAYMFAPKDMYTFEALKTDMASRGTYVRYGQSKTANIHHSRALSRRYPQIRCVSLNPGAVATDLSQGMVAAWPVVGSVARRLARIVSTTVEEGVKNQLWCAVSDEARTGAFYFPVGVPAKGNQQTGSEELEEKLWEWTEKELTEYV